MASPDAPATVSRLPDGRYDVQYSGSGWLDTQAIIDPIFALHTATRNGVPVPMALSATLDTLTYSGAASITVDGNSYSLADPGQIPGAELVLAEVVTATAQEDWVSLWDLMSDDVRNVTTLPAFTAGIAGGYAPLGDIVDVISEPLTYLDGQAGYDLSLANSRTKMSSRRFVSPPTRLAAFCQERHLHPRSPVGNHDTRIGTG